MIKYLLFIPIYFGALNSSFANFNDCIDAASLLDPIATGQFVADHSQKAKTYQPIDDSKSLHIREALTRYLASNQIDPQVFFHDYVPIWSLSELTESSDNTQLLIFPLYRCPDAEEMATFLIQINSSGDLDYAIFDDSEHQKFLSGHFQLHIWHSLYDSKSICTLRTMSLSPFSQNYFVFVEGMTQDRWSTFEGRSNRDTTHYSYRGKIWQPLFIHLAIADWEQHIVRLEGPLAADFHGRVRSPDFPRSNLGF
ncbi:MAG: hypothetical protein AAF433_01415 [Bacteroidota bacterium]